MESLKSLAKLAVVGAIAYTSIQGAATQVTALTDMDVSQLAGAVGQLVFETGVEIASLLLCLAFVDYLFQRFEFERSIRMSREEIKEELRNRKAIRSSRGKFAAAAVS